MAEKELDVKQLEAKVHDLAEAMDRVRENRAQQDDVVVDMKQAAHQRLELLARDLQPVFKALPDDNDQFEFALTNGEPPRLWVDMTSHVRMGRDRMLYEFVKNTRMGRTLLAKTTDRQKMAKIVTNYVAERVLERERVIEGEWVAMRNYDFDAEGEGQGEEAASAPNKASGSGWAMFGWFLTGILAGGLALLAWAWFGDIPAFLNSIR